MCRCEEMSNMFEVRPGRVYHWDVKNMLTSLHKGTKTVKVIDITERYDAAPLADVVSVETGEEFACDVGHLQPDPEVLKRKYLSLRKWYKRHNQKMIFTFERHQFIPRSERVFEQLVIVGVQKNTNHVRALSKDGIVDTFDLSWTKLNLPRNEEYDERVRAEMDEYAGLWEEDYFEGEFFPEEQYDDFRESADY